MRKNTTGQTVEITAPPLTNNQVAAPENPGIEWLEDFGTPNDIISIRLHRYKEGAPVNNQGFHPFVGSYEAPPTLDTVKADYGGGNYMLIVKYRDPETETGTNMKKVSFVIEGPPKIAGTDTPVIHSQTNGNGSISTPNGSGDILDTLIKLKQAGLIPDNKPAANDNALLLELMKQMHETNLARINAKPETGNDEIMQLLLKSALEKNKGELDDFAKWIDIIDKMKGAGTDESEIMSLIKTVAPALLPALLNRNQAPAPGPRMVQRPQPAQIPQTAGGAPPVIQPVNDAEIEKLRAENERLQYIKNFSLDMLDEIEYMIDNEAAPALNKTPREVYNILSDRGDITSLAEFNFYLEKLQIDPLEEKPAEILQLTDTENLNNNTDMFGMLKGFNLDGFITGLKNAQFDERVITLKQAANMFSKEQIFNFCMKHEIVKDIEDFNQYMTAANIEPLPTTSETT